MIATDRCAAKTHPDPAEPEPAASVNAPTATEDTQRPTRSRRRNRHRCTDGRGERRPHRHRAGGHDVWCSGKHKHHGGNIQVLCDPTGFPVRTSPVEPGSVHDITDARRHVLPALYAAATGLPTLGRPPRAGLARTLLHRAGPGHGVGTDGSILARLSA